MSTFDLARRDAVGTALERGQCEPIATLPRYTVSFFVDAFTDQPKIRKLYVVRYVPAPLTAGGFVYLPAAADVDGELNGIVSRPGMDGRWFRASTEWSAAINAHLAAR